MSQIYLDREVLGNTVIKLKREGLTPSDPENTFSVLHSLAVNDQGRAMTGDLVPGAKYTVVSESSFRYSSFVFDGHGNIDLHSNKPSLFKDMWLYIAASLAGFTVVSFAFVAMRRKASLGSILFLCGKVVIVLALLYLAVVIFGLLVYSLN